MTDPSDEVLRELGRMVIRASDLEVAVGIVSGMQLGSNMREVLGKPGAAMKRARVAIEPLDAATRASFTSALDAADELMRRRHTLIHALWSNDSFNGPLPAPIVLQMRTFEEVDVSVDTLQPYCGELRSARNRLVGLVTTLINR